MTDVTGTSAITLTELLRYERDEITAWEHFFEQHPEALDFPFAPEDGAGSRMAVVRGVIHHVVAVETRYCDRLVGVAVTAYEAIPRDATTALFAAARDANARLSAWIDGASEADLSRVIDFQTISAGTHRATARKVVAHTLLHGVRTWAQLATILRLHGVASGWHHDLLFSGALD